MFEVKSDAVKNRLYIKISGFITDQELKEATDKIISNLNGLKPGFDVINDISGIKAGGMPKNTDSLIHAQGLIKKAGVNRIIRVVASVMTKLQFSESGMKAGYAKDAETAPSLEEAEKMLDKK
jgi:hypothetical protein